MRSGKEQTLMEALFVFAALRETAKSMGICGVGYVSTN